MRELIRILRVPVRTAELQVHFLEVLAISPYISPYLPISPLHLPYISLYLPGDDRAESAHASSIGDFAPIRAAISRSASATAINNAREFVS